MSIKIIDDGDIFASGAEILVCPTNALGVFGAGLAKAFWDSYRWGAACRRYAADCKKGLVAEGSVICYPGQGEYTVAFAATKGDWRKPSTELVVEFCAGGLFQLLTIMCPRSIAIPALGCGLGKLSFDTVLPLLEKYLDHRSFKRIDIQVYAPKEKKS